MSREAMQIALDALEANLGNWAAKTKAVEVLRQALEEKQEPFEYWSVAGGWVKIDEVREHFDSVGCGTIYKSAGDGRVPLYTAPPKKEWVGLTDEDRNNLWRNIIGWGDPSHDDEDLMKAIEAKLQEKNT